MRLGRRVQEEPFDEGYSVMSEGTRLADGDVEKNRAITRLVKLLSMKRVHTDYIDALTNSIKKQFPPVPRQSRRPRRR